MDAALRQKIENRAYELFIQRNGVHGYQLQDWLNAEQEITGVTKQAGISTSPKKAPSPRKKNTV